MEEEKNKQINEENNEDTDDDEDKEVYLNLEKITSSEYKVKEKNVPLRAAKKEENVFQNKEKEPQDNLTKSTVRENRSNHKVVEVVHTNAPVKEEEEKGPQDSKKK